MDLEAGLHLKAMNAHLRLLCYLETHCWEFPPHAVLAPALEAEGAAARAWQARLDAEDEVAPGRRQDDPYLERFYLRTADLDLIRNDVPDPGLIAYSNSYGQASRVCMQKAFGAQSFIQMPGMAADTFAYIKENKQNPGW